MKILFENSEETNDPEKVNNALQQTAQEARGYANARTGIVDRISGVITADSAISRERLLVEHNDENKRLVINIDGKNYKIDLTEIT